MEPTKRISTIALAGIVVVAPTALELACSEMEMHELYAAVNCERSAKWFRAPFRESCDSLVERSFPPHNHAENTHSDGAPSTTVEISASGNGTNVTARMASFVLPPEYYSS